LALALLEAAALAFGFLVVLFAIDSS